MNFRHVTSLLWKATPSNRHLGTNVLNSRHVRVSHFSVAGGTLSSVSHDCRVNLSPHSSNDDIQHELIQPDSSPRILTRNSSPLVEQPNNYHNRQGFHTPYLRRCPTSGIQDHQHNCTNCHHPRTFRTVRLCANAPRQHFCTDGAWEILNDLNGVLPLRSSHNLHHKATRWLNALALA